MFLNYFNEIQQFFSEWARDKANMKTSLWLYNQDSIFPVEKHVSVMFPDYTRLFR